MWYVVAVCIFTARACCTLEFRFKGLGLGFRVYVLELRVWGLGFRF